MCRREALESGEHCFPSAGSEPWLQAREVDRIVTIPAANRNCSVAVTYMTDEQQCSCVDYELEVTAWSRLGKREASCVAVYDGLMSDEVV